MIEFTPRAKVQRSELAIRKIYRSTCGRFKLVEVRSRYGLGRYWQVIRVGYLGEYVVTTNKTRHAAERAFMRSR